MKAIHRKRLEKLAVLLDELPSSKWNFSLLVSEMNYTHNCGSVCCAIGWTPKLFPRMVEWYRGDGVRIKNGDAGLFSVSNHLFGMSHSQSLGLFVPKDNWDWNPDECKLPRNSSAKRVAKEIRKFLSEQ